MPFYDFTCKSCENEFNIMCSMKDKEEKRILCPSCGGNDLDRIFRPIQVKAKSSGGECPSTGRSCPHAAGCGCGH